MRKTLILTIFLFFSALINIQAQDNSIEFVGILSGYPAYDQYQFNQKMEVIARLDENSLEELAGSLQPEPEADNTALQYALNGFSSFVMKSGKEEQREKAVQAYGKALEILNNSQNQQFLIEQLELIGKDDAIPFLKPFLKKEGLVHPAAQALATINSATAKKTLLQALQNASSPASQIALTEALGKSRAGEAVAVITPLAASRDTNLKKVSLYALANIGDPSSAGLLAKAADESGYQYEPTNATSDYLLFLNRLIENGSKRKAKQLTRQLLKKTKKKNREAVHAAALQIQDKMDSRAENAQPINTLSKSEKEAGFALLFNGKNLNGWMGNKAGYVVKDGNIVVHPGGGSGGNLYTEGEYSDFILRFEFKLTSGANNGIGIRTPSEGDAAYVGMEIQVLDNTAPQYKNLHPYQYHGSVYGVIPAKKGYLNPLGQWNKEEIKAVGPHITVKLNGHIIVDGNIDEASQNGTMDQKSHPGLHNKKGHIGFLGHGSVVHFRNLRLKKLD